MKYLLITLSVLLFACSKQEPQKTKSTEDNSKRTEVTNNANYSNQDFYSAFSKHVNLSQENANKIKSIIAKRDSELSEINVYSKEGRSARKKFAKQIEEATSPKLRKRYSAFETKWLNKLGLYHLKNVISFNESELKEIEGIVTKYSALRNDIPNRADNPNKKDPKKLKEWSDNLEKESIASLSKKNSKKYQKYKRTLSKAERKNALPFQ